MSISVGGNFSSSTDTNSLINSILTLQSGQLTNLQNQQTSLSTESSAITAIQGTLTSLQSTVDALGNASLYNSHTATSSSTSVGTGTADSTAANGSVQITVSQLATNSVLKSGNASGSYDDTKISAPPAGSTSLETLLGTDPDGQTFTINGAVITLSSTDVIDDGNPNSANSVIGKINNSNAGVTASYNSTTGQFSLTSNTSSPIVLGSGADTSNFLQVAQLYNNGSTSVNSSVGVGRLDPTADLSTAGLRVAPTTGTFTINGVPITYSSGDSLDTVIDNINNSNAGVTAAYNANSDQVVLTATGSGSQGIFVSNGTSNLASALRLTSSDSTLSLGKPTLYTVGSDPTVQQSNSLTLSSSDLGLTGVTFAVTGTGTTNLTVAADASGLTSALNAFVTQYNSTQGVLSQYLSVNATDPSSSGVLSSNSAFSFLPNQLETLATSIFNSSGTVQSLQELGITGDSTDANLTAPDSSEIQSALNSSPSQLSSLFTTASTGFVDQLDTLIGAYGTGPTSVSVSEQNLVSQEQSSISNEIAVQQNSLAAEKTILEQEFANFDSVSAQSTALLGILGDSSSSSSSGSSSSSSGSTSSS